MLLHEACIVSWKWKTHGQTHRLFFQNTTLVHREVCFSRGWTTRENSTAENWVTMCLYTTLRRKWEEQNLKTEFLCSFKVHALLETPGLLTGNSTCIFMIPRQQRLDASEAFSPHIQIASWIQISENKGIMFPKKRVFTWRHMLLCITPSENLPKPTQHKEPMLSLT